MLFETHKEQITTHFSEILNFVSKSTYKTNEQNLSVLIQACVSS